MGEERICSRDASELAACFASDADGLFGYACVLTRGDRALAEDLVQAAFEAAARAWGIVRRLAEERRRAWLRTTVGRQHRGERFSARGGLAGAAATDRGQVPQGSG